MNESQKITRQARQIAKLEKQNGEVASLLQHVSEMFQTTIQALKYIAFGQEEERSKIILLNQVAGIPKPETVDPKQVAIECLQIVRAQDKARPKSSVVTDTETPERIQLDDGGEIHFRKDYDATFHECCGCGLVHEVRLKWQDDGSLVTEWRRGTPSAEEIRESGGEIIRH